MRMSVELVYSNNLCAAFLTAIVKAFKVHHQTAGLGPAALQKLTYFIKLLGAPVPCSFGIYTYGPYSDTVTFAIESLLADEVIQDTSTNPTYSSYDLSRNAIEILANFEGELNPHEENIQKAVKTLGAFNPAELQMIATLHFISQRQIRTRATLSKDSIIAEFKTIQHSKFADDQVIGKCHDALVEAGLISRSQPANLLC